MVKLTPSLETFTRIKIDNWLKELGWDINEESPKCNVFTGKAKTLEQNKKFKGKKPDYVLYGSETDKPVVIIEAKRKGESIEEALEQGVNLYAKPLGVNFIFAIDGTFVKSIDLRSGKELSIDGEFV